MRRAVAAILAVCLSVIAVPRAAALETDQFTVPPTPLVDLAPEFEQQLFQALAEAVERANQQHALERELASRASFRFVREQHLAKARQCLTEDYIVRRVFMATTRCGVPQARLELWARSTDFERQPARFEPKPDKTVYGSLSRPILMQVMSPTINLYGIYLGTDKLGHFFEQGYEYYEVYRHALAQGHDHAVAVRKAVQLGVRQENGLYGMAVDSVYSNADLAANYAGFKFYLNLTQPVTFGGTTHPPILRLNADRWEVNPELKPSFIRPYFTEHLNEAMNPSKYGWPLRNAIRANIRPLVPQWMAFYNSTPEQERKRLERMRSWYGEDYGHCGLDQIVALVGEGT